MDRRAFLQDAAAGAVALALPGRTPITHADDLSPVFAQIEKRHDEAVQRLQEWIRQPSIAAERRGMDEGCELTMRLLRDAGFGQVTKLPTDGQPGIFATLDAKGVIGCELVSSGERWGRGPRQDIHSSNKARVDSPAWHLVQALATLVSSDGNEPAIDGYLDKARPISPAEKAMVADAARRLDETAAKKQLGVEHWVRDVSWPDALERLVSRPTANIEGLVGGYTGPGGKTILPHRAVAKLDLRLVPDMTAAESLATLTAHL